jgi:hypothetical protein
MWVCVGNLADNLNLLRNYLDGLDKKDQLLNLPSEDCGSAGPLIKQIQDHLRSTSQKTLFDYKTVIISLYGYLERFIEDLLTEYLIHVSTHVLTFSDLPTAIREGHVPLSLDLARKVDYQRFAGTIGVEEIIAKLHSCFNTPDNYQLNIEAFIQHSANFRQTVVVETCLQSGLVNIGQYLRNAEPFVSFLEGEEPDRDVVSYLAGSDEVVFARLNDLANRRNDVAHGTPVDDILSRDLLRNYVAFVEAYAKGLALVVYEQSLPSMLSHAIHLGTAIDVFDSKIVCVNLPAGKISVGDILIAKTPEARRPFRGGPVLEIQVDHVSVPEVNGGTGVQIGLLVGFGAKINQEFYCVSR